MKRECFLGLIAGMLLGAAGCGDTAAQRLASDTTGILVSYEKQVDDKVNAENAFYATQRQNLVELLMGYAPPANPASDQKSTPASTPDATKSIYYGTIIVSAQREGRLAADNIVSSKGEKLMSSTIDYVGDGVTEEGDLYASMSVKEAQLELKLTDGLKPLDEQRDRLELARQKLVALSQPLSDKDQIAQLIKLGSATQKILKKQSK